MNQMRLLFWAAAFCTAAGAVAEPVTAHDYTITMDNMNFGHIPSGVKVGDTIVWDNQDTVQHSATARDGSFDVRLQPGKQARTVLKAAGTLNVYCVFHSMMRTAIKVVPN